MVVRALTVDDVDVFRTLRLRALLADPTAFSSTHERESAFDDTTWRSRLAGFQDRPGRVFIDETVDGDLVGVVGIGVADDTSDSVLWGMWVDPTMRGQGTGGALVEAAVAWSRSHGCSTVTLWVARSNDSARRMYERHGFGVDARGDDGLDVEAPDGCTDELRLRRTIVA